MKRPDSNRSRNHRVPRRRRGGVDLDFARRVLRAEARAVAALVPRVGRAFRGAAELILERTGGPGEGRAGGRVVTTGVGKAGIVAQKVGATLASTGSPALFLHPTEALHGDLGMVTARDLVLCFSNSGEGEEWVRLLPPLKKLGAPVVAVTCSARSTLGRAADLVLELGRIHEPCPLGLAPSGSTAALLALGDALALTVLKARRFSAEDYARLHPGGSLGRKLMRALDLMRTGPRLALVAPETTVGEVIAGMTAARGGAAVVVDLRGRLRGIFTDGDFRRLMQRDPKLFHAPIGAHMTSPCRFVREEVLVAEAQALMADRRINALPVVNARGRVTGLLDIQDLVRWPAL
jgi:arabinose-5-phosphate isomerase